MKTGTPKGFKKYEVKNNKVYNAATGNEIQLRDNGKYQLKNDAGIKKNVSLKELSDLVPGASPTVATAKKTKVAKTKQEIDVKTLLAKKDVSAIMDQDSKKNKKIFDLDAAGYNVYEIMAITKSNYGVVKRDLWRFKK